MSQNFGLAAPAAHTQTAPRPVSRYLVVIDAGGFAVARLFLESREQVAEFDASTEETVSMTRGLVPVRGASGPEWDRALASHSAAERAAAEVYTLGV